MFSMNALGMLHKSQGQLEKAELLLREAAEKRRDLTLPQMGCSELDAERAQRRSPAEARPTWAWPTRRRSAASAISGQFWKAKGS